MEKISIIIAEDDPIISWDLLLQLKKMDIENVHVEDTSIWIHRRPSEQSFDLIITNLKLIDGWVTWDYLDTISKFGSSILIVTGLRDRHFYVEVGSNQTFHYLYKPYTSVQFSEQINGLLPNFEAT